MSPMASDSGIAATLAPSSSHVVVQIGQPLLERLDLRRQFRHVRQFDEGHLGLGEGFGGRANAVALIQRFCLGKLGLRGTQLFVLLRCGPDHGRS